MDKFGEATLLDTQDKVRNARLAVSNQVDGD